MPASDSCSTARVLSLTACSFSMADMRRHNATCVRSASSDVSKVSSAVVRISLSIPFGCPDPFAMLVPEPSATGTSSRVGLLPNPRVLRILPQ